VNGRILLRRYLKDTRQNVADLSNLSGFNDAMIYRWLHGQRRPGIDSAAKLETVTNGKVPANSWVNGKSRKRRTRNRKAA
jgi:transcriptional regulator with XRE-family HTH domain